MAYSEKINEAIVFAVNAHAGQMRKGTSVPYIVHPVEAMGVVSTLTDDEDVIAAAVLHDVTEDAGVSDKELRERFGDRTAALVGAASEDKMRTLTAEASWKARKQATVDALAACTDVNVKIVVLGDKLANLRSIVRDREAIGDALWDRFNQKDPLMHKWYYSSFLETLSELGETEAYKEYSRLIARCWN